MNEMSQNNNYPSIRNKQIKIDTLQLSHAYYILFFLALPDARIRESIHTIFRYKYALLR